MPGFADIPGNHIARTEISAQATAGNADAWSVFKAPANATVTSVTWIPDVNVTGANTNNFALQLINKGAAGAGTTGITTVKTYASGTNSAAFVGEALTLSSTATDLQLAAGDVIAFVRTVNGTGLASPHGQLEVAYTIR